MGYDTPDFTKNPKKIEIIPPEGCDFYRPAAAKKVADPVKDPDKVVEVAAKVSGDGTAKGEAAKHASEIEKFRCKKCGYVCATEKGMKMHFTKAHKGE